MSLRFIVGKAGAGKTDLCIREVQKKLKTDPCPKKNNRIYIIVPKEATFQYENMLLASEIHGVMRAQVMSFERLALEVMQQTGGLAKKRLSEIGELILMQKVLRDKEDSLSFFKSAIKQFGFVSVLLQTISEFKSYDVQPEDLEEVISKEVVKGEKNLLFITKLKELHLLYSTFKCYSDDYIMPSDYLSILIKKNEEAENFKDAEFWFDGFYTFNRQEINVIISLAKMAQVNVLLTIDPKILIYIIDAVNADEITERFFVFQKTAEAYFKIMRGAAKSGVEISNPHVLSSDVLHRFKKSPAIAKLERSFFDFRTKKYNEETSDINIIAAENPRSEIEAIALEIDRLVREGRRYRDIAVLFRDIESYDTLIQMIFDEYDIPFFMDVQRKASNHSLIELVRAALEAVKNNWKYETVLRYLKTGFINIDYNKMNILENHALKYGITGRKNWKGDEKWQVKERSKGFGDKTGLYDKLYGIKNQAIKELVSFDEKIRESNDILEMLRAVYELLKDLNVPSKLEAWEKEALESGRLEEAQEHHQIWNHIVEILDQFYEVISEDDELWKSDRGYKKKLSKLMEILDFGVFDVLKFKLIPPSLDQVVVGTLDRTRNIEAEIVFIAGANDGKLPLKPKDNGLISDRDREELKKAGFGLSRDARSDILEEQFFIYNAITRAKRKLFLSYSFSDSKGSTLKPSYVIERLKYIFPKLKENYFEENNCICESIEDLHPKRALVNFAFKLMEFKNKNDIEQSYLSFYNCLLKDVDWKNRLKAIIDGFFWDKANSSISINTAKNVYSKDGKTLVSSISRIEKFNMCPFSHFALYGLGLKEREIYKLTLPDLGIFYHTALEDFVKKLMKQKMDLANISESDIKNITDEVTDKIVPDIQNQVLLSSARYKYLTRKFKRTIYESVKALVSHVKRGKFTPVECELLFRSANKSEISLSELKIKLDDNSEIKLCGKIDRIDAYQDKDKYYFRIIDYKSGQIKFDLLEVYYGIQLQLVAYMDVMLSYYNKTLKKKEGKEVVPAGMLYFKLQDPVLKTINPNMIGDLASELLKKFKMDGMVLADIEVVKFMDENLESGYSHVIPVAVSKEKKSFYANSKIYTLENFKKLTRHIRNAIAAAGKAILKGEITVKPYRLKDKTSCDFCNLRCLCQLDLAAAGECYRELKPLNNDKIWEEIGGKSL